MLKLSRPTRVAGLVFWPVLGCPRYWMVTVVRLRKRADGEPTGYVVEVQTPEGHRFDSPLLGSLREGVAYAKGLGR